VADVSTGPANHSADASPSAQAEALLALGRPAEAIPWLERAIADDPGAIEPRCRLALAFCRLGQYPRAIQAAERAIGVAPNHEWPHRLHALALLRSRRNKEAFAAAREAVRLAPDLPEVHVMCAEAELATGDKQAARRSAERAVSLAPERAVTHEILGEVLIELNQLPLAEQSYRRALALDPGSFEAMNNLGVVLQRQGREREAMDQFTQAARLNPTSTLAQKNLANAIDRHVDPRPEISWPVQIGLIALGILLPPVRLVMLVWWLTSLVIRRSRMQALPPMLQLAHRLQRRSRFSWVAVLFGLGVVGALLFGVVGPAVEPPRGPADLIAFVLPTAGFLLLAVVTGRRLWRRRPRRS
jgi:tetratricopeptide (TPR) repeat protein